MANNYTQISQTLDYHNTVQRQWLAEKLDALNEDDDYGPVCSVEDRPNENDETGHFWLYSEESAGDLEPLLTLVSQYQTRFALTDPWVLEWAHTCSKLRVGEFGGGAAVAYRGIVKWFTPTTLIEEWVQAQSE